MKNALTITFTAIALFAIWGCEPFLQKDISKYQITLNAPQDNDTLTGNVSFWWQEIEPGTTYRLQVASPNFDAPSQLLIDSIVNGYSFTTQLPVGVYQWRVRGENANSETPYSTRSFYIVTSQDLTTQTVILRSPSNNTAFASPNINFSWYPLSTATGYYFQILDTLGNPTFQQTVDGDNINIEFPLEGYYTWRVKATNNLTETVYSARSLYYDQTAPSQPAITFPTFNDTVNAGPVLLQWNRGLDNGSPITDSVFVYSDSLNTLSGIYYSMSNSYNLTVNPGLYYWRVRSRDLAGNSSPYSTLFKFRAQ